MTAAIDRLTDAEVDAIIARMQARLAAQAEPLRNMAGELLEAVALAGTPTGRIQVSPGQTIASTWGNTDWDQTVQCFASNADRDNQYPAPHDGALAYTADTATVWKYAGTGWHALPGGVRLQNSINGPMNFTQTSFAAAANWSGLGGAVAVYTGRLYRIRCVIPAVTSFNGNSTSIQLARDGVALGGVHLQAFITGALRVFGPTVEYVGPLAAGTSVFGIRGWNSQAGTSIAAEAGQPITYTVEDIGST
jgi:hypothetical protein